MNPNGNGSDTLSGTDMVKNQELTDRFFWMFEKPKKNIYVYNKVYEYWLTEYPGGVK